jgi:hypothetical protein
MPSNVESVNRILLGVDNQVANAKSVCRQFGRSFVMELALLQANERDAHVDVLVRVCAVPRASVRI